MNKDRRKRIAKAQGLLSEAHGIFDECASEEQDAFDNMPEGLQQGEKGEMASGYADKLREIADQLEEFCNESFEE